MKSPDSGAGTQPAKEFQKEIIMQEDANSHIDIGFELVDRGEYALALVEFNKVLACDSDNPSILLNRCVCYAKMGEHTKALRDADRCLALDPNDCAARGNRANVLAEMGHIDEALQEYTTTIDIFPRYAPAFIGRGSVYGRMGRFGLALADFDHATNLSPILPDAFLAQSDMLKKLGYMDEAIIARKKALDIINDDSELQDFHKIEDLGTLNRVQKKD